jgi:hypothetical protein
MRLTLASKPLSLKMGHVPVAGGGTEDGVGAEDRQRPTAGGLIDGGRRKGWVRTGGAGGRRGEDWTGPERSRSDPLTTCLAATRRHQRAQER